MLSALQALQLGQTPDAVFHGFQIAQGVDVEGQGRNGHAVGQGTGGDNAHRILYEGGLYLLFHISFLYSL